MFLIVCLKRHFLPIEAGAGLMPVMVSVDFVHLEIFHDIFLREDISPLQGYLDTIGLQITKNG